MQRESSLGYFGDLGYLFGMVSSRDPGDLRGVFLKRSGIESLFAVGIQIPTKTKWHDWKKNVKNTFLQLKFLILRLGNKKQNQSIP